MTRRLLLTLADEDEIVLVRRPLLSLDESLREPHKADRLTNRLRKLNDKFSGRRFNRTGYNRRQRDLYKKRIPQKPGQASEKRLAPPKYLGTRLRSR